MLICSVLSVNEMSTIVLQPVKTPTFKRKRWSWLSVIVSQSVLWSALPSMNQTIAEMSKGEKQINTNLGQEQKHMSTVILQGSVQSKHVCRSQRRKTAYSYHCTITYKLYAVQCLINTCAQTTKLMHSHALNSAKCHATKYQYITILRGPAHSLCLCGELGIKHAPASKGHRGLGWGQFVSSNFCLSTYWIELSYACRLRFRKAAMFYIKHTVNMITTGLSQK